MQYEFTNMQPVAQNKLKARNKLQMLTSDLFVHLTQSVTMLESNFPPMQCREVM